MDREKLEDLKETIELGLSEPDGFPRTSTDEAREALGELFDHIEAQEQRIEHLENALAGDVQSIYGGEELDDDVYSLRRKNELLILTVERQREECATQEQRIEELEKHNKEMRLALLDDIARESQELGLYDED